MPVQTVFKREVAAAAAATTLALASMGAVAYTTSPPPAPAIEYDQAPAVVRMYESSAMRTLEQLPVKGRAPGNDYDREGQFGPNWSYDLDRNGCDARNDALKRQLINVTYAVGSDCVIIHGWLGDPYSGEAIEFTRGPGTSTAVQIDHVVALKDAWVKGAQQLDPRERMSLANDPLNLIATKGQLNQQKGDGDAATWLPPLVGFRCEYVAHQVAVKAKYSLWVTQAEHDAIKRILDSCPNQPLPN